MKDSLRVAWISGMPRCGSSWVSQVFEQHPEIRFRMAPLFSDAFRGAVDAKSTGEEFRKFFEAVYHSTDPFLTQNRRRESGAFPSLSERGEETVLAMKDVRHHDVVYHLCSLDLEVTVFHIVRHPCASIYSWISHPKEFPQGEDWRIEWRTGACRKRGPGEFWGFDDWKKVTSRYCKLSQEYPSRVKILRYEKLVRDPLAEFQAAFESLDLTMSDAVQRFLEESRARHDSDPYSVYKSPEKVMETWKTRLDRGVQEEIIDELRGSDLETFLESP